MLVYTGGGCGGSLPGIPARDLTAKEVTALGGEEYLLSTGLFVLPETPRKKGQKEEEKGTVNDGDATP